MNLFQVLNLGVALSGVYQREEQNRLHKAAEQQRFQDEAIEGARAQWITALSTDETRAWLSISEQDKPVIIGLVSVLTLAGVAKAHDDGHDDSVEVRVIRGAISAAVQCAESAKCVISAETAQAFSTAATHAKRVIATCTPEAIAHTAQQLLNLANSKKVH
jgi:hypothetical protein